MIKEVPDDAEPHGWIIFSPAKEPFHRHVHGLCIMGEDVRITYRDIVTAGLRNPEADFNPADYFGYMFPMPMPRTSDTEPPTPSRMAMVFGLMHIDRRDDFFPPGERFDPTSTNGSDIRKASLRWIGYDLGELVAAEGYPIRVRYYKNWQGHTRLLTGTVQYRRPTQFVQRTLTHLLNPPGFSEAAVEQSATDLLTRLRSGNALPGDEGND